MERIITESEHEISAIAAEAKSFGMSYGNYTALVRGGDLPEPITRAQPHKRYCKHCGTDITNVQNSGRKSPFCAACGGNGSIRKLYKEGKTQ